MFKTLINMPAMASRVPLRLWNARWIHRLPATCQLNGCGLWCDMNMSCPAHALYTQLDAALHDNQPYVVSAGSITCGLQVRFGLSWLNMHMWSHLLTGQPLMQYCRPLSLSLHAWIHTDAHLRRLSKVLLSSHCLITAAITGSAVPGISQAA